MFNIFNRFLDLNQKEVDRLRKIVDRANAKEDTYSKLKKVEFAKKTEEFKKEIKDGKKLEDLLPDAFALVREASKRVLNKRHYDVQLMASAALFEGRVAEQKTGEGKTLSAVPALYLRALTGKGVHLVTVNDYLARIGAGWNGPIFEFLGMTTGVVAQEMKSYIYDQKFSDTSHGDERLSHLRPVTRREAYSADITYGTNNEFGFDYLRDNMVQKFEEKVQRGHYFAIVDEVDSVLIDEARTPLIISAPDSEPTQKYYQFADIAKKLDIETDFKVDEKRRAATLTEDGIAKVEKILKIDNLYETDYESIHHIENALRAKALYLIDRDYVVKDNQVIIVDEFTGRLMNGRRWSDGLHQAVEAKENVAIQQESKTLATISFQNYFRMYDFLSGMTGTASTEAEEFKKIYKLDVVAIPTHRAMLRRDHPDVIYKTPSAKYNAMADDVDKRRRSGQPVLIGTTSIEKNELIASVLRKKKIPHNVLNAKNHEKEALIIADAGKVGAVTVATNMAGRGVDIILGGAMPDRPEEMKSDEFEKSKEYKKWKELHDHVVEAGGLHVVGTERHESRRIDNQLRGRAGRQGDPGSSQFYLSLEDDLMRIFGGDMIQGVMTRLNIPEGESITNPLISRAIEQAQVKVEGFHFDTRKQVVDYDDVVNQQRDVIYTLRNEILTSKNLTNMILDRLYTHTDNLIESAFNLNAEAPDIELVMAGVLEMIPLDSVSADAIRHELENKNGKTEYKEFLQKVVLDIMESRKAQFGEEIHNQIERFAYLGSLDRLWIDHIDQIDDLREGIRLRAYGQRDPLVDFKQEAYTMFESLVQKIDDELCRRIFRINVASGPSEIPLAQARENIDTKDNTGLSGNADVTAVSGEPAFPKSKSNSKNKTTKIGRNDPCWCGSGKKFKKCHYPKMQA